MMQAFGWETRDRDPCLSNELAPQSSRIEPQGSAERARYRPYESYQVTVLGDASQPAGDVKPIAARAPGGLAALVTMSAIGVMFLAQTLPQGVVTQLLPTIYRSQGLDLRKFWVLSLVTAPSWIRWLWAPVVDRYAIAGVGRRRSWIIPCSLLGAASYGLLAFIDPRPRNLYWAAALMALQMLIMTTQEMAVDGYMVEALYPRERGLAAGIRVVMEAIAELLALAGIGWVYSHFGWRWAISTASGALIIFALPLLLRRERPVLKVQASERPSVRAFLRRPHATLVCCNLLVAGAAMGGFLPMIGAFLVDHRMSVADVGAVMGVVVLAGMLFGASAGIWWIEQRGISAACWLAAAVAMPAALIIAVVAGWPTLARMQAILAFTPATIVVACYYVSVQTARMGWAVGAQVATDYALGTTMIKIGQSMGVAGAGFAAANMGWRAFFPAQALLVALGCVMLALTTAMIARRGELVAAA